MILLPYRAMIVTALLFTGLTFPLPSAHALTVVVCSGNIISAPVGSPTTATASCVFTTTASNNITGVFSPTQLTLTGPSANQKATFQSVTGSGASVQDNGNGNFTATSLHTPITINANYTFTPTISTLAGTYSGTVSVSWTAL